MGKTEMLSRNVANWVLSDRGSAAFVLVLMLSGIGDPDDIKPHGIDMVAELKGVGKNLQDHLQARPVFKTSVSTINTETNSLFKQAMIGMQYALTQRGPMTMADRDGTRYWARTGADGEPELRLEPPAP